MQIKRSIIVYLDYIHSEIDNHLQQTLQIDTTEYLALLELIQIRFFPRFFYL